MTDLKRVTENGIYYFLTILLAECCPIAVPPFGCDFSRRSKLSISDMPSSAKTHNRNVEWPETPTEQTVPESFEITGDCVIERILGPLRDKLPLLPKDQERTLGGLAPGSIFVGYQNAAEDSKQYPVEVSLKDVDLNSSFLCGYLTIHNLTQEYPHLTTFFEAEIIGPKYGFITDKWEAGYEADERHWGQFEYFNTHCRQYLEHAKELPHYSYTDHDCIFMRWKEHFLVPDHHIETVHGASYAGFYYIAYDKAKKTVEGYYYHRESKDYQKLVLQHVQKRSFAFFEFR